MSYWRMRRQTELFKKMAGRPYKEVPPELIELEEQIKKLKGELVALRLRGAPEAEMGLRASELAPLEYRFRQILITSKLVK